jgi:hypothetical protein
MATQARITLEGFEYIDVPMQSMGSRATMASRSRQKLRVSRRRGAVVVEVARRAGTATAAA